MKVHRSFEGFGEIKNPVVTTGSFDGVHVGHRVIIQRINFLAKAIGGESVLITFYPHPRKVLFPDDNKALYLINSSAEKEYLLSNTGLDHLFIIDFTLEFSRTPSDVFVKDILLAKLKAKIIVVGFNHHFGHNRQGDYHYLYNLSREMNFRVEEIPQQDIENEAVSSTRIRKAITSGKIGHANAYLNHPFFFLSGVSPDTITVDNYRRYSLKLDASEKILPPSGRYAAKMLGNNNVQHVWCDIVRPNAFVYLHNELDVDSNAEYIIELHMLHQPIDSEAECVDNARFVKDVLFLSELIY